MFQDRKRTIFVALVASCILAPFIFFSSPMKSWESDGPSPVTLAQQVLYPFESAWHTAVSAADYVWTKYIDLTETAGENLILRSRLAQLKSRIMDYEEQMLENARLRKLLGFAERYESHVIVAEVIGPVPDSPFQSLRISLKGHHGVRVGMPVVAADGVVGRIIRVGVSHADVQLLTDANFKLYVLLQRTRVRGTLSGSSQEQCRLQLHKAAEIRIGDTIISAGIVGGFPKGLAVGRVMRISYESEHVAQAISIEPWVDHRRLEEVMVIYHSDEQLQKIVDAAGPEWLELTLKRAKGG